MDHSNTISYIRNILDKNLPDGRVLLKEGRKIGESIEMGRGKFLRETGYDSYFDYKEECVREGKIEWFTLMGLSSWEEHKAGIREFKAMCDRCGFEMNMFLNIFNMRMGLPKEMREGAPGGASFMLESPEEYLEAMEIVPAEFGFTDHHLSAPNTLESTINAVKAGSRLLGTFSEITFDYPGFHDNVKRFGDTVKSLGICSTKYDQHMNVLGYMEDGIAGFFSDCASFVAYALLEKYIVTDLCGARYCLGFGGLLHEGPPRVALAMALAEVLSEPGQRGVLYINSSTTMQWDHDIDANYGSSAQEFLLEILVEKKYKLGMGFLPVSITEALQVPTTQELFNIFSVGKRIEERSDEWLELMDFTPLEKMRDVMIEKGTWMFNNMLKTFEQAGVDIGDPLQMLLLLKKYNYAKLETDFHPSMEECGIFRPYYPTVLGRMTIEMRDKICDRLNEAEMKECLKGKKIVVCSADVHTYGLNLVESVLSYAGAEVINGGLSVDPIDILELADEEGTRLIGISVHSGQSYNYARQLAKLCSERGKDYYIFMGGKLNGILPGDTEPSDCTELINELGIHGIDDLFESISKIVHENDT